MRERILDAVRRERVRVERVLRAPADHRGSTGLQATRTSPETSSCVFATNASSATRTGENHRPSYTVFAQIASISRFAIASAFVRTRSSSAWCAGMSVIAAGASYSSRLLIPTARFSTMSMRPIPYAPA